MEFEIKALPLVFVLGICSCHAPRPEIDCERAETLPSAYSVLPANAGARTFTNAWWTAFDSDELNRLMARALAGNLTLARAGARLRQARAEACKTTASRHVTLTVEADGGVSRRPRTGADASGSETVQVYDIGLAASYEIDLWGRMAAAVRRDRLAAVGSQFDLEAAVMTVAAQVADRWIQLIEARKQEALLKRQIETNRELLGLLKERLGRSSTRLLDVYQQEQAAIAGEAALPAMTQRVDLLRNEITGLVGVPTGTDLGLAQPFLPRLPAQPGAGIPADLLRRRPDVRAELHRLQAAGWDAVAARADRFPTLRITASAGTKADSVAALFDDWLANLAAGLVGPLLDGRRRRAEVDRLRAGADEQLASYRRIILDAVREVEDALLREQHLLAGLQARTRELASARQVVTEAQRRYLAGAADYLPVLTALRSSQQSERELLGIRREILANRVALCRALGGSWATQAADNAARTSTADRLKSPEELPRRATP